MSEGAQEERDDVLETEGAGLLCVDEVTGLVLGFHQPPGQPGLTMPFTEGVSVRTFVEGLES